VSKSKIFLVTLLLAIGSWAWWHNQQRTDVPTREKNLPAHEQDYFIEKFSVTTMTPQGKPARTLTASKMKHFRDTGITELEQPFVRIYNKSAANWKAASEQGELSEDGKTLILSGNVEIDRSATPDSSVRSLHISTSNLRINADQDYAETDDAVKITSDTGWVQAVGMQAWLREPSHIKFLSRTRAHYEVQ
jgi:lipopolysaccharide export system protein LptC